MCRTHLIIVKLKWICGSWTLTVEQQLVLDNSINKKRLQNNLNVNRYMRWVNEWFPRAWENLIYKHMSDPRVEPWLILHQAQIEASFWGDLPSGIGLSSASVQPQLLDGRMVWPPAKRNVYTNTHNCSVRGHGELPILRWGGPVCCDFSETGARCSSGKNREVERGGGGEDDPTLVFRIHVRLPCLKLKHRQSTVCIQQLDFCHHKQSVYTVQYTKTLSKEHQN